VAWGSMLRPEHNVRGGLKSEIYYNMYTRMKIPCAMFSRSMLPRALAIVAIGSAVLPSLSFADSRIERVIQGAGEGSGTVIIQNSSVSTGGQTAASGQAVSSGNSSASSKIETHVNSSSSEGSSVQVKVETEKDGVVETKEYSDYGEPGKPVRVNVSAQVNTEGSKVDVSGAGELDAEAKVDGESTEDASMEAESEAEGTVEIEAESRTGKVFRAVPNFFKKVFSFLWPF